ncbi:MAG: bifunctional GNAT family N-acetyltransferase/carbon-nitrogen hydrolase family protein [Bacteroidetes bacterium]|nr:bifunctional GNAT family N-acetyltransferase/carbon-nitrogen hydrolase family protein [Bacteroidota bacterium]
MTTDIGSVELRQLETDDYDDLKSAMLAAYRDIENAYWRREQIEKLIEIFPEGQAVVQVDGQVAAVALSILVNEESFAEAHSYQDITANYSFETHNPDGDTLYGIDIFVKPEFRGLRLGRRLYDYRKELCENLNLKRIVFGGRLPNYHKYASEMSPREYIQKVRLREIYDPVLTFQLSNDFHVKTLLKDYLKGDESSQEYAALLQWDNIYYERPESQAQRPKTVVRLGLVQWQMRPYKSIDELYEQMEFFVDAVSGYRCDFALFPEFFNAPLMSEYNDLAESDAIRKLAEHTLPVRDRLAQMAISYNTNIITGSMPLLEDGALLNVGYVCKRDGGIERYEKLHVTPDEARVWGMRGGSTIRAFDTDCGRIGVLICYDVEFPELGRILADKGVNILFVPFLTDTQNGYSRVRNCARARAIENECYVAIAGSVGNLPKVHNMDIQFAQSVVFTPCDFAFPTNGVKAEATPNTEMILIADVDLDLLKELHRFGAVRNLNDRRKDVFELRLLNGQA